MLSSPKLPAAGEAGQNHLSRVISGLHKQLSTIIQLLPGASGQTDVTHKVGALWEVHLKAKTRFKKNKNQKKQNRKSKRGRGVLFWPMARLAGGSLVPRNGASLLRAPPQDSSSLLREPVRWSP